MSDLAQRIANLSPERRALLERRLTETAAGRRPKDSIPRRPTTTLCPASFAQERLWFLTQFAHNIVVGIRLQGALDLRSLERALDEIVARHETLRTNFVLGDGGLIQLIAEPRPRPLRVTDLGAWRPAEREAQLSRLLREETQRPFDLARDPVLRVLLVRLTSEEHALLLVIQRIASDAWSTGVLLRELSVLYEAFVAGRQSPLPELPIQYADYALWQRSRLAGERLQSLLAYWTRQLAGAPVLLEVPTDRPRPPVPSYEGARHTWELPTPLSDALKRLTRKEGATPFMLLLAAFQILLYRYTRQPDIVVGSPIAGRTQAETEGLIGFFANTLALRTVLGGNPTFRRVLERVRAVCLEAYAHQELPFEKLVEALQPARHVSHAPLFQVMFAFNSVPRSDPTLSDLVVTPLAVHSGATPFDLTLTVRDTARGFQGTLGYATDLFDPTTISRMLGHFRVLLEGIVANPDQGIATLPLLSEAERQQLLVGWNATETDLAPPACVSEGVETQSERTPDAVAAVFDEQCLTYRTLNRRANQLAWYLRRHGVGPGVTVGICLERSLEMLVGLLGVLKAGGVYLPLDPSYPAERLAFMLADARVGVVVTQARLAERCRAHVDHEVCVDTQADSIACESAEDFTPRAGAEDPAYVIYTSGSTGTPKGVEIPHRAVVNVLEAMRREPGLTARDTLLAVSPISFDIAALELFLPLTVGARVVIVSREVATDGRRLSEQLRSSGATVMQATPATWRLLIESGWEGTPGLRIWSGGEALSRDLADRLRARGCELWNLYGSTETTMWSTAWRVVPGEAVLIGRPIANTQLYVLDPEGQPVPIGVTGELYIGGAGLARGYLNRPELTAERFVPDPFGRKPGGRLYRTGDLARYRSNGDLECLGRIDDQVKIRGFRIEPDEIEMTLREHPAVRDAVVVAEQRAAGDTSLVAYVVPAGQPALRVEALREFLKAKLPVHLVPARIEALEGFPLTPNGKLDRRAVAGLQHGQAGTALSEAERLVGGADSRGVDVDDFEPPRTAMERALAAIWQEVLGRTHIGLRANFFDVGGHSLLAMRVIARVEGHYDVRLSPRDFMLQNLGQLAALCDERRAGPPASGQAAQGLSRRIFRLLTRLVGSE